MVQGKCSLDVVVDCAEREEYARFGFESFDVLGEQRQCVLTTVSLEFAQSCELGKTKTLCRCKVRISVG